MYNLILGDCCEEIKNIGSETIHFSIFSPPFAELYVYSNDYRDMGNCKNYNEFFKHFEYLTPELYRILMPGRLVAVHCMDLPIQKGKEGYIGLRDFSGMLIDNFQKAGFIYHSRVTIWKDPVTEMQRTKAIGLLNKQKDKDATLSRVGIPDYLLVFRKDGDNPIPVKHSSENARDENYIPISLWQKYASPVWMDINYSKTLNKEGRENDDEKHIAPLQLETIERAIHLWTNPGETIFTPFAGIGSEVYQAVKMGRQGIGIELKESYFKIAQKNCKNALEGNNQLTLFDHGHFA
jgi:DNA modification methylase